MLITKIKFQRTESQNLENGIHFKCKGNLNNRISDTKGNLLSKNIVWEKFADSENLTVHLDIKIDSNRL
jgi:hypothetical protein